MAGRMVRTQIYLPADVHAKLKARAERHGLTLALQIRAAIEEYFKGLDNIGEDVLRGDDPIFRLIGIGCGGESDASLEHDHYLYGWPKRRRSRKEAESKRFSSQDRRDRAQSRRRS